MRLTVPSTGTVVRRSSAASLATRPQSGWQAECVSARRADERGKATQRQGSSAAVELLPHVSLPAAGRTRGASQGGKAPHLAATEP